MKLTVVIPTHSPHTRRLCRALEGLRAQTLPAASWECLLVDNASTPALALAPFATHAPGNLRLVTEPQLGLTPARRHGLQEARGEIVVFVDDDNVLAPGYLAHVVRIFESHPRLGAAGGPSRPEFESQPPTWAKEFFPLLALRDLGDGTQIAKLQRSDDGAHVLYPGCAPIGAGMALRRDAIHAWLAASANSTPPDRQGAELTSGGDNDIVLTLLHAGWEVGYFPELDLTHLIPSGRLDSDYLARLNRGIQKSWMQVLTKHGANPWPLIAGWTVLLRTMKAWFTHRAWSGPAARIHWQGACGHFEGRCIP